jgi:hypothetical protein
MRDFGRATSRRIDLALRPFLFLFIWLAIALAGVVVGGMVLLIRRWLG